jgi:hypothetical protein
MGFSGTINWHFNYQLIVPLKAKEIIYKTENILANYGHTVV